MSSCSESDASFLECIHKATETSGDGDFKIREGRRYLIIDVGKGTTDFSIVRMVNAHNIVSEYRAGFVGAGNAISYGIFSNYMHTLAQDHHTAKRLTELMLSASSADLFRLENNIEDIKRNWSDKTSQEKLQAFPNITGIKAETINDRIENSDAIDDTKGNIENILVKITAKVIKQIPTSKKEKIDFIVFSGRSFMFKPLYAKFKERLIEKFGDIPIYYDETTAKNGCLFGPIRDVDVSLQCQMVGFPKIRKFNEAFVARNTSRSNGENASGGLGKWWENNRYIRAIYDTCTNIGEFFSGGEDEEDGLTLMTSIEACDKEISLYMNEGKSFQNLNENSVIVISGNLYKPEADYIINSSDKPYSIYFDGEYFYLKSKSTCHKLIMQARASNEELLAESLFPYSKIFLDNQ